jgi:CCR4-NOT transcription complex subunit 3
MNDLKKEIKKLQRFREDIMKWFANPEVKDKTTLTDARKRIEVEMERFKAFERESKTKPFSMVGLAMGDRLDAHELKKQEKRAPVEEIVDALTVQGDEFRAEWESLTAKKKKSKDEASRIDELKKYIDWHAFHVSSLEQLLRRLDNDLINPDDIDGLIETLQLYQEQFEDPDYFHDEEFYEQYNLDSDAVDATYYKPVLSEDATPGTQGGPGGAGNLAATAQDAANKIAREVPMTAAAKARAKKIADREVEAAANGGPVRPDYPSVSPPRPTRPPFPTVVPPPLPSSGNPPNRPAPVEPGLLPSKEVTATSVWQDRKKDAASSPLESSWESRPLAEDLARCAKYAPSNMYIHGGESGRLYPASAASPVIFKTMALDTLILVFYYREGTHEQYLASQELKRRHWRFHTKFGVWFQRSGTGSVKTVNPAFEFGSYNFFDVANDQWGTKTRSDLTFEYEFLDDDQIPDDAPSSDLAIRRPVA